MKKIGIFFVGMLLVLSLVVPVWAQEVSLNPFYAQRNLDGKVRMHINMTGATDLLSTGVKVIFPPDKLQVESASKNTDVWKFEPLEPDPKAYLPEVEIDNTNGVVKMIGGRLTGVSGDVLLGWIVFQCNDTNTGEASVTVELANPSPYDHFVRENETVDDGSLGFTGATICIVSENACEGDFDGNGGVDGMDFGRFRPAFGSTFGSPNYDPAADFDANGGVDGLDFGTFRPDFGRSDCPQCLE